MAHQYVLKGTAAKAARMLDEVREVFTSKAHKVNPKDDWRLEYYIMQVMCSDMFSYCEIERERIEEVVKLACGYDRPAAEWKTAFTRLVRGKFLYSRYANRVQFEPSRGKTRYYGLDYNRYKGD